MEDDSDGGGFSSRGCSHFGCNNYAEDLMLTVFNKYYWLLNFSEWLTGIDKPETVVVNIYWVLFMSQQIWDFI